MNPLILAPVMEIASNLISRWFPDPEKKAKAEFEMMQLLQTQDFQRVVGQLQINAAEAAHQSIFVAGWRPFVGWCCGLGFLWASIGHSIFAYVAAVRSWPAPPAVDTDVLLYVLGGMLGLGTLRTIDKSRAIPKA